MRTQGFSFNRSFFLTLVVLAAFLVSAGNPTSTYAGKKKSGGGSYIGILMQDLTEELLEGLDTSVKKGVLVSGVMDDSPAEKAGLEEGDIIVEYDGTAVNSPKQLKKLVVGSDTGDKVKVKVVRDNKDKVLALVVGEQPEREEWSFHVDMPKRIKYSPMLHDKIMCMVKPTGRLGVEVRDLDEKLGSYFKVGEGEGVLVLGVHEDSAAEEAGIEAGDVIVEVAGDKVSSIEELKDVVGDLEAEETAEVTVMRHGRKKTLTATMKETDLAIEKNIFIHGNSPKRSLRWYGSHDDLDDMHLGKIDLKKHMEYFEFDKEEFRKEMDELKTELKEMKKELKKLKK